MNPGGRGCRELRSGHWTLAWTTRVKLHLKNKHQIQQKLTALLGYNLYTIQFTHLSCIRGFWCIMLFFLFVCLRLSLSFAQAGVQWCYRLTVTSDSQVKGILLPQPLEQLGL